ncbi:hypothetical protein V6N13_106830 [Hibiscus sabdariffa]
MTSVQEEISALAQRWSEWSQLHDGDNGVDKDDSGAVEICIYNHSASSRDPFAKKNNDKNHGRTNNANGKAPEESNVEDHNNFSHIRVQSEAHMQEKGTNFNAMGATARKWYRSQMKAPDNMPRDREIRQYKFSPQFLNMSLR